MSRSFVRAVARKPGLWVEAVRTAAALTPERWWARRPPVPIPDGRYLAWRTSTAYGRDDAVAPPEDVTAFLVWRRRQRKA